MSDSERKIVQAASSGDRLAFRELVLEHSHAMFRLAWRLVNDEALAEDIVQEAFVKAWGNLPGFRFESSFKSWLHRITVNTAMDALRKQSRRGQFEGPAPEFETMEHASLPRHEIRIDISRSTARAMHKLSETERTVLMLRHYEGHSIREIAEMLEMTADACKQAIFRAVRKMRIELQPLVCE
ncbi:MAG: sigma-70 family RNA polymerase sigma factor [Xanthomonadales bacterium]|nr:sigma-70 family RNA polymerase sigma factor [Xanthomonadales bacterium]